MFQFSSIKLTQFRNYSFQQFLFNKRIVGICGPNGSGKTNLLDALYYLCFTKSYFSRPDSTSVQQGFDGFRIDGVINNGSEALQLVCILRENGRKEFSVNNEIYKKFSLHIGKYPGVMIAPDDVQLISGGSEDRRSFIDTILSQLSPVYLDHLIKYGKVLQQRNGLLKAAAEHQRLDDALLDILDEQLIALGNTIFEARNSFLRDFIPLVQEQYISIGGDNDEVELTYESQLLKASFANLLQQNRQRDLYLQRTGQGVHKDDIDIQMQRQPFKSVASQGQRKSLLFALKLAEYIVIKNKKGFPPILLLDDVFEKLDEQRMSNLLHKVCNENNGQVFITDTHKERLQEAFDGLRLDYQLIELGK